MDFDTGQDSQPQGLDMGMIFQQDLLDPNYSNNKNANNKGMQLENIDEGLLDQGTWPRNQLSGQNNISVSNGYTQNQLQGDPFEPHSSNMMVQADTLTASNDNDMFREVFEDPFLAAEGSGVPTGALTGADATTSTSTSTINNQTSSVDPNNNHNSNNDNNINMLNSNSNASVFRNGVNNAGGSFNLGRNQSEVDESPPFTIESDLYFDPMTIDDDFNSKQTPQSIFVDYNTPQSNQYDQFSTGGFDQHSISSSSYQPSQFAQQQPQQSQQQQQQQPQQQPQQQLGIQQQFQQQRLSQSHYPAQSLHSASASASFHRASVDSSSQQMPPNTLSGLNQNSSSFHELSPLTTVNSHTPSISSVHSQQVSFFSAQQYLTRNSIDQGQPPSSLSHHRPSLDMYSKSRVSIDSQQSYNNSSLNNNSINNENGSTNLKKNSMNLAGGRNNGFSFTNYIPFMSDKTHQRLDSGPPSPSSNSPPFAQQQQQSQSQQLQQDFQNQSPQQQQQQQISRHLIRSIFKSRNPGLFPPNEQLNDLPVGDSQGFDGMEGLMGANGSASGQPGTGILTNSGMLIESAGGLGSGSLDAGGDLDDPSKKPKKIKRSLFTRFKSSNMEESNSAGSAQISTTDVRLKEEVDSMEDKMNGGEMLEAHSSVSIPSSSSNNQGGLLLDSTSSNTSHNNVSTSATEPDYAALFEKVGKRKNIVNTSSFIKNKPKKEQQQQSQQQQSQQANLAPNSESDVSLSHDNVDNYSYEGSGSGVVKNESMEQPLIPSENPSNVAIDQQNGSVSSTIANASKRILGSKLLKKKSSQNTNEDLRNKAANGGNDSSSDFRNSNELEHPDSGSSLNPSSTNNSNFDTKTSHSNADEVELGESNGGIEVKVDLKELDLPPNTQIFPTSVINAKTRTRGRKENKEADMSDSSKIFLCSYCSRRFKRQEHLKRHFRSLHTFEKPYDCNICHKKFSRSDNLNQHLKIHKQEEEMAAQGLTLDGERIVEENGEDENMLNGGWSKIKEEEV